MGKRKADNELTRFVWRRNPLYDVFLLNEVEINNPYAQSSQKTAWKQIADALNENQLHMKVTDRSCRERVAELIKMHRRNELASIRASSSSENEAATFRELLEKVVKLEEATPNKQLKSRTKNDREEAEIERSNALSAIDGSSSDESKSSINDDLKDDFEFGPKKARKPSNPKKDLIKYLEKKSKDEIATKREELRIREKELDITRLKAEADIEERKKMTELLMKLATQKP